MIQFDGDSRQSHELYCHSESNGELFSYRAHIERIHQGKRGVNDICAWAGHIAECQIPSEDIDQIRYLFIPNILNIFIILSNYCIKLISGYLHPRWTWDMVRTRLK